MGILGTQSNESKLWMINYNRERVERDRLKKEIKKLKKEEIKLKTILINKNN